MTGTRREWESLLQRLRNARIARLSKRQAQRRVRITSPMVLLRHTRTAAPFHGLLNAAADAGDIGKVDFELDAPSGSTQTLILVYQRGCFGRGPEVSYGKTPVIDDVFAEEGVPPVADSLRTSRSEERRVGKECRSRWS